MKLISKSIATTLVLSSVLVLPAFAKSGKGRSSAQMLGLGDYRTAPIFTVGESIRGYTPPGIPDGMAAYDRGRYVQLLVNHELGSSVGYDYNVSDGNGGLVSLRGARISSFWIDKKSRRIRNADLAYDIIYNRDGSVVTDASQLTFGAFNRFCSSVGYPKGKSGFVDDIYLTGEETGGGSLWALDVEGGEIWACPAAGVGAWENVTALEVPSINETHIALLMGDDRGGAPLYLYIGEKTPGNFLERNGLARGQLFMWVANDLSTEPADFAGTGNIKDGVFVKVVNLDAGQAGMAGFDSLGYATQANLDAQQDAVGAFRFSRPEDLSTHPLYGNKVIFASTGRDSLFPEDSWGTIYVIDVAITPGLIEEDQVSAVIRVSYDGDDAGNQDFGIRSPDNLTWADNLKAFVQEDRSIGSFGADSGEDASIWRLNPKPTSGKAVRVARMNRDARLPKGQVDEAAGDIGNWESSGIIDVSKLFGEPKGSLLLFNVQAHGVRGGAITEDDLVEGGQILFLEKKGKSNDKCDRSDRHDH